MCATHMAPEVVLVKVGPTWGSGVISKVLSINNIPVMIQVSGCTGFVKPHVLSTQVPVGEHSWTEMDDFWVLWDNTSGASFPHINMSIPVSTVWPLIAKYQRTGDERYLAALTLKNKQLEDSSDV
nr:hypothetical protein BaRGS_011351 [Batillaria attramentaria]